VLVLALVLVVALALVLVLVLALALVLVLAPVRVGSAIRAMRLLGYLVLRLRPPRRVGRPGVALLAAGRPAAEVPGTGQVGAEAKGAGVLGAALDRAEAVAGLAEREVLLGFQGVAGPRRGGGRHRGREGLAATFLVSSRPLRWSPSTWGSRRWRI
jgi:hypothetical protein